MTVYSSDIDGAADGVYVVDYLANTLLLCS